MSPTSSVILVLTKTTWLVLSAQFLCLVDGFIYRIISTDQMLQVNSVPGEVLAGYMGRNAHHRGPPGMFLLYPSSLF